jgi:hypothetical protein
VEEWVLEYPWEEAVAVEAQKEEEAKAAAVVAKPSNRHVARN